MFSVIIPAHNEAENLKILLPRLQKALQGILHQLVVVDNASNDNTQEIVAGLKNQIPEIAIVREPTLGYGRAVLTGLKNADGEVIGIIRADNQEKPEDLAVMYSRFQREGWDFCKAIRKSRKNDGFRRIIISQIYNFLFKTFFGLRSKDINATPKIFTREVYENFKLESKDWFIDAEMVIKAERLGYKIGEVEIEYLPRLKGQSTVKFKHLWEFLKNMIIWYKRLKNGQLLER